MSEPSQSRRASQFALLLGRTLTMGVLILVGTRMTLEALGPIAFGVLSALTAVAFVARPLGAALTYGGIRHLAVALGATRSSDARGLMGVVSAIGVFVSLIVAVSAIASATFVVGLIDTATVSKQDASLALLLLVLGQCLSTIATASVRATLNVREQFGILSLWDISQGFAVVAAAVAAQSSRSSPLIAYALAYSAVLVVASLAATLFTRVRHWDLRPDYVVARSLWTNGGLLRVPLWHLAGESVVWLRTHAATFVISVAQGPAATAAFAIGVRVDEGCDRLSKPVADVYRPGLLRSIGAGDHGSANAVANTVNRMSAALVGLAALPLLIEPDFVLRVWLGTVPANTGLFVALAVVTRLLTSLSGSFTHLHAGRNELGTYLLAMSIPYFAAAAAWAAIGSRFDALPWAIPAFIVAAACLSALGTVPYITSRRGGPDFKGFVRDTVLPILLATSVAVVVARAASGDSLTRTTGSMVSIAIGIAVFLTLCWTLVLKPEERQFALRRLRRRG